MMKFRENEDAVSPVIGVILMVAITVILAAVIAAFVFGMTGNIPDKKDVYVTTKLGTAGTGADAGPVMIVTIQGGNDISALKDIKYSIDGDTTPKPLDPLREGGTFEAPFKVGNSGTIDLGAMDAGSNHIVILGEFADGTSQILAERDYVAPEGE